MSGDYGHWRVAPEHHGAEVWVVAEPPRHRRFRNPRGQVGEGLVYRRADGLVARAEYLELLPEFRLMEGWLSARVARAGTSSSSGPASPAAPGARRSSPR